MKYVIGIDVGTSGTKSVLYDQHGNIIHSCLECYDLIQPQNGWAEQRPKDWWDATITSLKKVIRKEFINDIVGMGVSGQMHGLVLLDAKNRPLMNSIIWCDGRTEKEVAEIIALIGKEEYISLTLNAPNASFTLSKLLWVKNNLPDIYSKIQKVLLPKDYINFCLTGEFATDVSDAGGTGYFDVKNRDWCNSILDRFDINKNWLPKIYESQEVIGNVSLNIAKTLGLAADTIVVAGAGDQAAAGLGNGILSEGNLSISLGTSGVVFSAVKEPKYDCLGRVHTFCHAIPGMWHVMGVTQACGLSVSWFVDNFCKSLCGNKKDIFDNLEAGGEKLTSDGIIYLPYLMGERTPHLDSSIRGAFVGISASHTVYNLYKAVIEGVCFSLKDCYNIISGMDIQINNIRVGGGGSNSDFWLKILSGVLGENLWISNNSECGSLGVAVLASVGSGIYQNIEIAIGQMLKNTQKSILKPQNIYKETYKKYIGLYSAIKSVLG